MTRRWTAALLLAIGTTTGLHAADDAQPPAGPTAPAKQTQPPPPPPREGEPPQGPPRFGPGGPGGFSGPGGPMQQPERQLVAEFDKDKNGWLDDTERRAAREQLKKDRAAAPPRGGLGGFRGGPGGPGGPGGSGGGRGGMMRPNAEPAKPGPHVSPSDVQTFPDASLYEPLVLRTIFLEFSSPDWEAELVDFHNTDVDVPATLVVDGKRYPNVGVHFRGMSSYMGVGNGYKRSLNVAMDLADKKQRLYGFKTFNLLNSHEDASFLHTVLFSHVARQYIPAPRANHMKVVINGESWGVYVNAEQFNADFAKDRFGSAMGARWKVRGSPRGGGGLVYSGEDVAEYKRHYEIKSADKDESWKRLIELCRVLNQTPTEQLEKAITPILDVEGALWFLALDDALVNNDGYWVRDSDYSILLDKDNRFHVIPHDMNETFQVAGGPPPGMGRGGPGGGPGFRPEGGPGGGQGPRPEGGPGGGQGPRPEGGGGQGFRPNGGPGDVRAGGPGGQGGRGGFPGGPGGRPGGPGGGGVNLDPLVALDDVRKPLRSRLLAVPALRQRYLAHVKAIAQDWLDWNKLGPIVEQHRALIEKEVEADTRKLEPFAAFQRETSATLPSNNAEPAATNAPPANGRPPERPRGLSLRQFAEQRRAFLLNHAAIKALPG